MVTFHINFSSYAVSSVLNFKILKIDLKIIECLLESPRMTFIDISRKLLVSQRTVIRRIEKLQAKGIIINFGITYNPSITKGYNNFSTMLWTQEESSKKVIENISYSDLNDQLLIRPHTHFKDVVILNFYSENVSDITSISERLRNLENVKEVQSFNPLK